MADNRDSLSPVAAPGIQVLLDRSMEVLSLRYFDAAGAFSGIVHSLVGMPLPDRLRANTPSSGADGIILAWRGPTEALLLCAAAAVVQQLQDALTPLTDGCMIDLT